MDQAVILQLCPFSAHLEAGLHKLGAVVCWFDLDDTARASWLAANAGSVRAVATGGHLGCSNEMMAALPNLGLIAINGVGFDKVDLQFAKSRGIHVSTTPDVLTDDVADLAIGLIISLLRELPQGDAHVRQGRWPQGERPLARKVSGRRFGVLGLGRIGLSIAQRLAAFGPVAYSDPHEKEVPYTYYPDLRTLAEASDVLIVACAANDATYRMVDAAVLEALGPQGYLVNVSRGSVVDEAALVAAITEKRIAGAALDVFAAEPNVPEALRTSDRTLLTPHVASATVETRTAMADLVLANVKASLEDAPLPTALV